ncbi:MAG: hypothetical protein ACOZNI_25050 [Myxococcota bacterium]
MFAIAIGAALAQDVVAVESIVEPSPDAAHKKGGGKKKKDGPKKFMGWSYKPYVSPGGGARITSGNEVAIEAGADVGVKYWRDNWVGNLYAGGTYATGASYSGYELHVGDTFGRREKFWGLGIGVEGFYDGYFDADGGNVLAPSFGVDIPLELTLGPKKYYVYGGVTPSFLSNRSRHVDTLPFGDELEWEVGAGLKLEGVRVRAGFAQRITVAGTINTPTLSVTLGD